MNAIAKPSVLAHYDAARKSLAAARRVDEVTKIRDEAQRMRLYARQAKDRGLIADAAELQLRAERRLGELLIAAKAAGQVTRGRVWPEKEENSPNGADRAADRPGRGSTKGKNNPRGGSEKPKNNGRDDRPLSRVRLGEAGISKDLSAAAQKLAALPEKTFAAVMTETREKIMSRGARVLNPQSVTVIDARRAERRAEAIALAANPLLLPEGPFVAGVCDPPWDDPDNPIGFNRRHYGFHYPLMAPAAIAALPVAPIFGPSALIMLWITRYHLALGSHLGIMEAWDFKARTIYTWNKEVVGLGKGYARDVTEHIVLGVRGDMTPPDDADRPPSLFSIRKSRVHSQKPDWAEEKIELWLAGGSYVSLFQRGGERKGWARWGHEVERTEARK